MAFALPIVERISRDPYGVWAVILTPTRQVCCGRLRSELTIGNWLTSSQSSSWRLENPSV